MRSIAFIILLITAFTANGQQEGYRVAYAKAMEAYKKKSYPEFYKLIKEANNLHPYHQGILYQLGVAAALNGHAAEAIANLKNAILIDNSFPIEGLSDFNTIKNDPGFKKLLTLQKELGKVVIHSDTALILKDRQLHSEGVDFDPATGAIYLGSIHKRKIVKVVNNIASDFCESGISGMSAVFSVKLDIKRGFLWACASPVKEMERFDSLARSAVFKFDLTGKLLKKFERPAYGGKGIFGDLTISKNGEVFISDGETTTIYLVNEKKGQLEPWYTTDVFSNMQGIAFSEDEKKVFIADYIKGLYALDVKTKTLTQVKNGLDLSLKGIDGLYTYKNSLITIQNGVNPMRVSRISLNHAEDEVTSFDVIDQAHPAFHEPTLGSLRGDTFYYIANSQWAGYDAQRNIKPAKDLLDPVVLRVKLK